MTRSWPDEGNFLPIRITVGRKPWFSISFDLIEFVGELVVNSQRRFFDYCKVFLGRKVEARYDKLSWRG